jgi:pimeloyl-ACP methyl ester carboxylesterase
LEQAPAVAAGGRLPHDRPIAPRIWRNAVQERACVSFRGNDGDRRGHDRACRCARSRPLCFGRSRVARAAYIVASQHGQRLTHCIALSVGYAALDPNKEIGLVQIERYWYQWYLALPQGERLLREKRTELAEHAWRTWSPSWHFPEAEFRLTALSFDNPDWAEITVHSYRHRWGIAEGDPDYAGIEAFMNSAPPIAVPTLVIHCAEDRATLPESSEGKQGLFSGRYQRIALKGMGHFPQCEAPKEVARTILDFIAGHDRDMRPLKAAS